MRSHRYKRPPQPEKVEEAPKSPPQIPQFTLNSRVLVDVPGYGPMNVSISAHAYPVVAMEPGAQPDPDRPLMTRVQVREAILAAVEEALR